MNERGVTLVELIVVMSVTIILVVALAFSYQGWQGKYRVESQTKTLYTDLLDARSQAVQRASIYFVDFPTTTTYRMSIDDSDGVDKSHGGNGTFQAQADPAVQTPATDTTQPTFPKTLQYRVTWAGGTVAFDRRGLINTAATPNAAAVCIFTDFNGDKTSDFDPDYDCIILEQTRVRLGKLIKQDTDGGICAPVLPVGDPNYNANNACQPK